jgi:hypothetical protein
VQRVTSQWSSATDVVRFATTAIRLAAVLDCDLWFGVVLRKRACGQNATLRRDAWAGRLCRLCRLCRLYTYATADYRHVAWTDAMCGSSSSAPTSFLWRRCCPLPASLARRRRNELRCGLPASGTGCRYVGNVTGPDSSSVDEEDNASGHPGAALRETGPIACAVAASHARRAPGVGAEARDARRGRRRR